jgi:hypothetical protein
MPQLTRRRSSEHREEWWKIYYGDVHVGTISERTGNPHDTEPWEWRCGFYPGSRPGECTSTFLDQGGTPDQYRAALACAIKLGWLSLHESGTYVKFTPAGAEMFA